MKTQIAYLNKAVLLASQSTTYEKWPLAAIIVKSGNVISIGYSKLTNDPLHFSSKQNFKCSVHAEAAAIHNAPYASLKNSTLYVARVSKNTKTVRLARPCDQCMALIVEKKIKKVLWTINSELYGFEKIRSL